MGLDDFSFFELEMRKRSRGWEWSIGSRDSKAIMRGRARKRVVARYEASSALLLLLMNVSVALGAENESGARTAKAATPQLKGRRSRFFRAQAKFGTAGAHKSNAHPNCETSVTSSDWRCAPVFEKIDLRWLRASYAGLSKDECRQILNSPLSGPRPTPD
ncbi:hypothetical protein [Bradyrhizobium sp. SHOUNA76]|uniref:hypothetical protein n=1 Tax=Bradyrhizobium sp. SHOUNA76 TaxID=2908927 RepID=UPI001FF6F51E|nr:hypothetical protein [Bradyrhizobium sp. SHOUNA76]MCJ9699940.1 hypothetical protein [Bradyrhizobium sp. SHOUNA76]